MGSASSRGGRDSVAALCGMVAPAADGNFGLGDDARRRQQPRPKFGYNPSASVFDLKMSFPKSLAVCSLRVVFFARAKAAIEESALHRVARQCER